MSAYLIKCTTFMFREKVLDVDDGKERVDVMEICPDQALTYPRFREHECTFTPQVFLIFQIE